MDIQAEKLELVRMLLDTNNEKLLKKIKELLAREKQDETSYLLSTSANKAHLEEGIQQAESGKTKAVDLDNVWK